MTTNERMNYSRYSHFQKTGRSGSSPFDRGMWQNLVDFVGIRWLGCLRPIQDDWSNRFDIDHGPTGDRYDEDREPLLNIV